MKSGDARWQGRGVVCGIIGNNVWCSTNVPTCYIDVELTIAHTASELTLGVTSDAGSACTDESFGVSEVKIEYFGEGACHPMLQPSEKKLVSKRRPRAARRGVLHLSQLLRRRRGVGWDAC